MPNTLTPHPFQDIQTAQTRTKKNVIIYARYSSDLQNPRSIDDQIQVCTDGLLPDEVVTHIFTDHAETGSHLKNRSGLQDMLRELETGRCDVVLSEGLDRITRNPADGYKVYLPACYHQVLIRTLIEGEIDEMKLGLKGTMNSLYLKDLKYRTRRGMMGLIRQGKSAGGRAYGYDVQYLNEDGTPERGLRVINPQEADVVRSIYEDYAAGCSASEIARGLNEAGIAAPRGGKWSPVTINGHYDRGDGILQNAVYRGLLVWGRCPEKRHPVSDKRHIRTTSPDEWVTQAAPELRIVSDELWFKVQALKKKNRNRISRRQPFKAFHLDCLCAGCGARMARVEHKYLICDHHKRYKTCLQNRKVPLKQLLRVLHTQLADPDSSIWDRWMAELSTLHKAASADIKTWQSCITAKQAETTNLINALSSGLSASKMMKQQILESDADRLLDASKNDKASPLWPVSLPPNCGLTS